MIERIRIGASLALGGVFLIVASAAVADPPVPGPTNTVCPTVQCMRVTAITDNFDGSFDVQFETFNWFNTTDDGGVNRILFFTSTLKSKFCTGALSADIQVDVLGASAPPGWIVVQADNEKVEFATTGPAFAIPDVGLCDPAVIGGCFTGAGCGNDQGGFVITVKPAIPTGDICSWVANWRHLDAAGLDNGDVMNFGATSWTFGSIVEDYSNTEYPPYLFPLTDTDKCAKVVQKKAAKYGSARLKQYAKCRDVTNNGGTCDVLKRDTKVNSAKMKLEKAVDDFCTDDDQVANVAWCGTTIANLKTCLVSQINASTDSAITSIYGP